MNRLLLTAAMSLLLCACSGDDGSTGVPGTAASIRNGSTLQEAGFSPALQRPAGEPVRQFLVVDAKPWTRRHSAT